MTTQYVLTDTLPKDAGNQTFAAWADVQTSILDFVLPKGIGASVPYTGVGFRVGHLAIATHTQGSPIEPLHPLVAIGGVYIENATASPPASAVTPGSAQIAGMTNWNELLAIPAPKTASKVSTSFNTVKTSSGVVFGFTMAIEGATAGDPINLIDGDVDKINLVIDGANGTFTHPLPPGGVVFNNSIKVKKPLTGGGNASITVVFH